MENLKKKIIEDLNKTGFPLEVSVASELNKQDWMVNNNTLYLDEDTAKERELDIHAVNVDYDFADKTPIRLKEGNENKFISHLIIQCRKSNKPWVFFDNGETRWPQLPPENFKSTKLDFHEMLFDELKNLGLKKHRYINCVFHKSYHESFSNQGSSSIYEALITTTKALKYFKRRYGVGRYGIHLFIPIVVFDGTLWSARLSKRKSTTANSKITLVSTDRVFVVFNQLSQPYKKNTSFEEEQIIEVVSRRSWNKYLLEIKKDNKAFYRCWTEFINRDYKSKSRPRRVGKTIKK